MFRKVLVANRGEIAVRILRALRERRIPGVAVYSDADRASLAVQLADEAAFLGPSPSAESYLRIDKLIAAARAHGADAIHPGYGFLSENADFAAACAAAGITFIGPTAAAIRALGSKTAARQLALAAGAPVVPGTDAAVATFAEAKRIASRIGYPVMIKAAAGGGGKGMRVVDSEASLEAALRDASSEAERSFKSAEVYLEKALIHPRHVEIQLLGDNHGNLIHLGERECSLQRRHQKVIEESPSPLSALDPDLRHRMGEAALKIARAAGYSNAGTAEFLVDHDRNFYFLEMNTRLQVEHPVTELVTSLDLVHLQLDLAAGAPLSLRQQDIRWTGHAIECRLYAEDPANNFFPSPGVIERLELPSGPGVRLDSGVYEGWRVPLEYDPLLAKLAVWAPDRPAAIARLERALSETVILGIRNNIHFFRQLLADPAVLSGDLHTTFLNNFHYQDPPPPTGEALAAALAAYQPPSAPLPRPRRSAWRNS
ncbi:MAG: acetyl-CoA carboxylase biotin carboxylase subunit [Acidobacteriaceae bacterium]|nr:acetyl-CoA carboxylase biotin carboxylase subunit [Acidobacteriaceae bacterium]